MDAHRGHEQKRGRSADASSASSFEPIRADEASALRGLAHAKKPVLVLRLGAPSRPHERQEVRKISLASDAAAPVRHAGAPPLWITAKTSLASCERLEGIAWLALALSSAAVLVWSLLSALAR